MFASDGRSASSSQLDLRTLRAVRVLRPLKLVSGVPSKTYRRPLGRTGNLWKMAQSLPDLDLTKP